MTWLANYEAELTRRNAVIDAIDRSKLAIDKAGAPARSRLGQNIRAPPPRLIKELKARGINEQQWCRRLGKGFAYSTIMRRIAILKGHLDYVRRRDVVGDNGRYGTAYAAYLARPEKREDATSSHLMRTPIVGETPAPDPDHRFLIGEAHVELRKLWRHSRRRSASHRRLTGLAVASIACWRTAPLHRPPPTTSATRRRGRTTSTMSCGAISAHSNRCCATTASWSW